MRNLLNPKWIFLVNTFPLLILLILFYRDFHVVESLLTEQAIGTWKRFGFITLSFVLINFIYGVYLTNKRKTLTYIYGLIVLLAHVAFFYMYGYNFNDLFPRSVPSWMINSDDQFVSVATFIMPTLAYSLLILIVRSTPSARDSKSWKNFLMALAVPTSWYIFSQVLIPLWQPVDFFFYGSHVFIIFVIIGTLFFLFFLAKSIYILAIKKRDRNSSYNLIWKIGISIILPLLGLAVNSGNYFWFHSSSNSGIFGNFSSYWFLVLAIINGLFICAPNLESLKFRVVLFTGRSITFAYTFYFFLVFLPFLPLSLVATIAMGTGLLMLVPLLLFIVHATALNKDIKFLVNHFSKNMVLLHMGIAFLVIPSIITVGYLKDKNTLEESLEYVYKPDYSKAYDIDKHSLQSTLDFVKRVKSRGMDWANGKRQPYLSNYFNWLVLDNLTLSDYKINMLESIFFGSKMIETPSRITQNSNIIISDIATSSTYDTTQDVWKSWINLEIKNNSSNRFAEYTTAFDLPEGVWISDYYLYVGDRKEMGILAEKKTAMWIYSSIRNENRDPGILNYLAGNKILFRVFPFRSGEVRRTGFEVIHKEPIQLSIDENEIILGEASNEIAVGYENENSIYLTTSQKSKLEKAQRKPRFHFVIDASDQNNIEKYIDRIKLFCDNHPAQTKNAKIISANTFIKEMNIDSNWQEQSTESDLSGGFYLDRAVKSILYESFQEQGDSFPVIISVTDHIEDAIILDDLGDWHFTFPESHLFYNLPASGILESHSMITNPKHSLVVDPSLDFDKPVLVFKHYDESISYVRDNIEPSIILKSDITKMDDIVIKEKDWRSALNIQAASYSQLLHPEYSDQSWLSLVKASFKSKVMTPMTAYIAVENEAQKEMLERKQKQVLASDKTLDLGEEVQQMSEPSLILLLLSLTLFAGYRRRSFLLTLA